MSMLNTRERFFPPDPQVEAANKLSTVGNLLLLMPQAYAKLEPLRREGFYGFKALDHEYQSLIKDEVNEAFDETYQQDSERWRGSFIERLQARALEHEDEAERQRMARIISVFEAVIARNHLPK